jgi:hypothetical protein
MLKHLLTTLLSLSLHADVQLYVRELPSSDLWGSFHVVCKYPGAHTLHTFESMQPAWEDLQAFFESVTETPPEMAVIAVGAFSATDMLSCVQASFLETPLNPHATAPTPTLPPGYGAIQISAPTSFLLEDLLQQRLEECVKGMGLSWIHPHPRHFYPVPGFTLVPLDQMENTLAWLLWNYEALQRISPSEIAAKKGQLQERLLLLTLAAKLSDEFLYGPIPSASAIQAATLPPLPNPQITLFPPLAPERVEEIQSQVTALYNAENLNPTPTPPSPHIIRVNDNTGSFYALPLSQREMGLIDSIITTIATDNLIKLALNKRATEKKGKKIEHVHPLRFMGYILSHRTLKEHARTIRKSSFKWDAFIDGFAKRMREEMGKHNVFPHIPGFAEQVGSTPEHVNRYLHKKDFEGLVKSLL